MVILVVCLLPIFSALAFHHGFFLIMPSFYCLVEDCIYCYNQVCTKVTSHMLVAIFTTFGLGTPVIAFAAPIRSIVS